MVAVPEKARLTVTAWPEISERVAVTVATPPASAMGLPLRLNVTVGGGSSSRMVPVPVAVVVVVLIGWERLSVKVSSTSSRLSGLIWAGKGLIVPAGLEVGV